MNDSYMIGQMNTFMHRLSEQMSGWLGKRLPKLTDEWWRDLVYNNLSQLQRDNVDAKGITELKGLDLAALLRVFDRKNGIVEGKNLIVTYDDEKGGLDSDLIQKIIEERFDLG